ncbi:hypothetical protein O3G_MSEX001790 [Manduca sexta]|uniref:Uncharacterized protein n=1 Tax=Manduca sexta TaxID=7130 RepID=A0A921YLM4_MANSE|nr:hypothetical protein O3G_MSEX001790 [Manduca sexta]
MSNMELVLICIALFLGESSQQINSEELDDILDKLINQIKNNDTFEVTNASDDKTIHNELIDKSPDESKIIYVRAYNKPNIEFIPDNVSDESQEYPAVSDNISRFGDSQNISETNENETENILEDIGSLSDIATDKDENLKQSTNKPKIIILKDHNNPILREANNSSDFIAMPLDTQDTRRRFDNLSLPDEVLNLIKNNKDRGIILKEIVVEIQHNAENNTATDVVDQPMTSKPKVKDSLEDVRNIINNTTLSDITTERSEKVTVKISGKKRNQKKPSKVTNTNKTKDSRKQHQSDSYLTDRTVPFELKQEQYKALNLNIPQVSDVNVIPTPIRIENLEPRTFLWSTLPKARLCQENCVLRTNCAAQ